MEFEISAFWVVYIVSGLVTSWMMLNSQHKGWKLLWCLTTTVIPVVNTSLLVFGFAYAFLVKAGLIEPIDKK